MKNLIKSSLTWAWDSLKEFSRIPLPPEHAPSPAENLFRLQRLIQLQRELERQPRQAAARQARQAEQAEQRWPRWPLPIPVNSVNSDTLNYQLRPEEINPVDIIVNACKPKEIEQYAIQQREIRLQD